MSRQRLRVVLIFTPISFVFASTLPKILCLHGRTESGPSFQSSITDLTNALNSKFQFVFTTAPIHLTGGQYSWYNQPPNPSVPTNDPNWASQSVNHLNTFINTHGPFAGILGYSQGSAFGAYYLSQAPANSFQFAMLFCGYLPDSHLGMLTAMNNAAPFNHIPALVWMGANDNIIPPAQTQDQALLFTNPTVVNSASGGHSVPPASDSTFSQITAFANARHAALGATTTTTTTTKKKTTTTTTASTTVNGTTTNVTTTTSTSTSTTTTVNGTTTNVTTTTSTSTSTSTTTTATTTTATTKTTSTTTTTTVTAAATNTTTITTVTAFGVALTSQTSSAIAIKLGNQGGRLAILATMLGKIWMLSM